MGFFDSEARVRLSEVEKFKEELENFYRILEDIKAELINNLKAEQEEIEANAKTMEQLTAQCEELYSSIQKLKAQIEASIRRLREQLANTPKEIETVKTDDEGNETVERKPNPEYAQIEKEIKEQERRLSQVKEVSWAVYNKKSELRRQTEYLYTKLSELKKAIESINDALSIIEQKTTVARNSIEGTVEAIRSYCNVRLRP